MTFATQVSGTDAKSIKIARYRSSSTSPRRKVYAATLGSTLGASAGSVIAILVVSFLYPALKSMGASIEADQRKDLTSAITTIVTAGTTFMFGYKARPGAEDSSVKEDEG
jgi:hypothetical protein